MQVIFNDDEYDRIVHNSLPDMGEDHCAFIVKDNCTAQGRPGICLSWVSMTDNGPKRVQMVLTVRNFLQAATVIAGKYTYLLDREWPSGDAPQQLSGHHKGVGWNAIFMEKTYVIHTENNTLGFATSEESVEVVARGIIEAAEQKGANE